MITVTINDKVLRLEKPVTVLEAARKTGISIPSLCHYPGLEAFGGCRLCLVEVEKMPKLQTSCTLFVSDGMVVRTESEEIAKARKGMIEFLLINHALDCPYCDKAGECELQDLTAKYGAAAGRFEEGKRKHPESFDDPLIVRNMERCISCTRCVRMCHGVQGASAISMVNRSSKTFVEPFSGGRYNCEYCGNCLTVCPVGAIMSRLHRHAYRPWQMEEEITTICPYCAVGCGMVLQIRSNGIVRTVPRPEVGINKGILCARGRFGYGYIQSGERLTSPLVRKNGRLEPSSWDEAITLVAKRLKEIREREGGEATGGIASGRCTNEENYIFQKLIRAGLGSNNIDSIARTGFAVARRYMEDVLGHGATANIMSGIPNSEGVIVAGGDPTHISPVLGVQVREAFRRGAKVFTIGYTPGLDRFRTYDLSPCPFTEATLLRGVLAEILRLRELPGENKSFEARLKEFRSPAAEEIEKICGVKGSSLADVADGLCRISSLSMIVGPDIVQRTDAATCLFLLSAIAYMLNARVYILPERPNEQGAIDMGCLPDELPGSRPVDIYSFRKRVEAAWGCEIPSIPGLTLLEMIAGADSGKIKALYIMGENPVFNLPGGRFVVDALKKLEFLVVQDIFLTETAELAHVVFPSLGWAEKEGTYTNLERRIQRLKKAVERQGMEDWRIAAEIGKKLGIPMPYLSASDIMSEISEVSPLHKGLTYEELERGMDIWPYKGEPLRQRPGSGDWPQTEAWVPAETGRIYLSIEKHMFLSGTMSRHSSALGSICQEPVAKVSPHTGQRLGLDDGSFVVIKSMTGEILLRLKIEKGTPDSIVLLTNNFRDKGALGLVPFRIDGVTKAPCFNGIEVTIERADKTI